MLVFIRDFKVSVVLWLGSEQEVLAEVEGAEEE
jgi:hypothetical protein